VGEVRRIGVKVINWEDIEIAEERRRRSGRGETYCRDVIQKKVSHPRVKEARKDGSVIQRGEEEEKHDV